jgi:hypothetical protein
MTSGLTCPACGRANQTTTGVTTADQPKVDDVLVCWGCRTPAILTAVGLRLPTLEEAAELACDEDLRAARAAMAESYTPAQAAALADRRRP